MGDSKNKNAAAAKMNFTALSDAGREVCKPEQMMTLGRFVANMIRIRTKLGYGVKQENGAKEKLAPLKESTKAARQNKALRGDTTPGKSNLTESGQLLDSIQPMNPATNRVTILPSGGRHGGGISNEDLAKYMTDGAPNRAKREFMNLSEIEHKQIKKEVEKTFRAIVREKLLKKR